MVMADGMASMNAARSVWGLDIAYNVGSGWLAGYNAMVSGDISITVGWVGGRESCVGPSSMSVSLEGAGGSRGVDLVLATIIIHSSQYGKSKKTRK
jgi:hypothetical protein